MNSKALALGIAAIAASGASGSAGCSSTKPTEIVPGTLTQVQVPKDLAGIQVEVSANGKQVFCQGYQVAAGFVELPSTLGVIQGAAGTTVRITIRGYDDPNSNDLLDCNNLQVDQANAGDLGAAPRVLRQAVLTYVDQHTLFLPMPLSYSCYDKDCSSGGGDSTCIAGQCASGDVDPTTLPDFTPGMVDGTQQCFSPSTCFQAEQPAVLVDPATCTYTVPPQLAAAGSGLNVKIAYTDDTWVTDPATGLVTPQVGVPTEEEILSVDANEGFTIPDPSKSGQFALAAGLCSLAKLGMNPLTAPMPPSGPQTFHTITDVEVAVGCPAKLPLLPFCAAEQHGNVSSGTSPAVLCNAPITLEPTPSAIYVAMDNSASMGGNSGGAMYGAFGAKGAATALNLSFALPVFRHTYVAFDFLDHLQSECNGGSTSYLSPLIPFGLASAVQPLVAAQLLNPPSPPASTTPSMGPETYANPSPLYLDAALGPKAIYQHISDLQASLKGDGGTTTGLNVGAAMLFVNRYPSIPSTGDAGTGGADSGTDYPITAVDCKTIASSTNDPFCGTDPNCQDLAAEAKAAVQNGLTTYFVVLNDQELQGSQVVSFYNNVAQSAGTGVSVIDATMASDPQAVLAAFEQKLFSAATCLYDLPAGIDANATLTISVPPGVPPNTTTSSVPLTIAPASAGMPCTKATATTASGWGVDNGHIRICGASCQSVQGVVAATAALAIQNAEGDAGAEAGIPTAPDGGPLTVPDVPLSITENCGDAGQSF